MKRFLFFCYRDWAIDIFNKLDKSKDSYILATNNDLCNLEDITSINPDLIFFYGWSWIIPDNIIKYFECLCLHPSKLPKYRGGSPIQNQVIAGEQESAVTIFKMNNKIDAGPICFQEEFYLKGDLNKILKTITEIGYKATLKIIHNHKQNQLAFYEQNIGGNYCKRRNPNQSEIKIEDFLTKDSKQLYNKIRCLQDPYPNPYIKCKKGKLIIKEAIYEQDI